MDSNEAIVALILIFAVLIGLRIAFASRLRLPVRYRRYLANAFESQVRQLLKTKGVKKVTVKRRQK